MSLTALAYICVFFVGIFVALQGRPLVGLMLYLQSFYFHAPGSWWGNHLPDLRWSLLSALVTLIAIMIRDGKLNKQDNISLQKPKFFSLPEHKLFLAFVIWVWFQSIWAIASNYHQEYAVMVTKFLFLLFLMHKTLDDERSILVFIIASLIGCTYFGWIGFSEHQGGRFEKVPTPGLNDGNLLSLHMMPIVLLSSFLLLCDLGKYKYVLLIPIALTLNGVFLTQSRGAIVGAVAGAILALLFRPYKLRKPIFLYLLLACVLVVRLVPDDLIERLSGAAGPEEQRDKSAESRLIIISAQYKMFLQSPLHGHGHRGTLILSPDFIDNEFLTGKGESRVRGSHNLLMSLLVDFGLIGAFFYLLIVLIYVKRLFVMRQSILHLKFGNISVLYMAGVAALVALMISSMLSNSLRLEIDVQLFGLLSAMYCLMKLQSLGKSTSPKK